METEAMETKNIPAVRVAVGDAVKPIIIRLEPTVDAAGVTTFTPYVVPMEEAVDTPQLVDEPHAMVESQHAGNIGERVIIRLKVLKHKILRTMTTVSYLYEFRDMDGNIYQWLTHRNKGLDDGNEYYLKCTVKKFYKRRGVKITAITRCRVI